MCSHPRSRKNMRTLLERRWLRSVVTPHIEGGLCRQLEKIIRHVTHCRK
ncbi:hypothetical protein KP509_36G014000 [Ceratopteris richardii]|uniref:Uncharacterized protein n=1 Tax=Ceratopteris richardii TaxID=49495 RepID=A0A8T2QAX2_CERRI|nr:hypothetical protein KP509_36G014000 [Ceratopteris richardii]